MSSRDCLRAAVMLALMMPVAIPVATHAEGIETAFDLLKMCGGDGSGDLSRVSVQLDAGCGTFINAVDQAHHLLAYEAPLYCLSANSTWPIDAIVTRFLNERRDRLDLPAAAMVIAALGSAFPCR